MRSFDVFFDLHLNKWLSNNGDAGDLRRHSIHYDMSVMLRMPGLGPCLYGLYFDKGWLRVTPFYQQYCS